MACQTIAGLWRLRHREWQRTLVFCRERTKKRCSHCEQLERSTSLINVIIFLNKHILMFCYISMYVYIYIHTRFIFSFFLLWEFSAVLICCCTFQELFGAFGKACGLVCTGLWRTDPAAPLCWGRLCVPSSSRKFAKTWTRICQVGILHSVALRISHILELHEVLECWWGGSSF